MTRVELVTSPDEIRTQMVRVLASKDFDASDRNRRFLDYVVTEAMAGRADRIKAYSIATQVFGRNEDFDPQQDAIVRIEAGRMRRSLDRYYLTSGRNDEVRISIPVGSYVPAFMRHSGLGDGTESAGEGALRKQGTEQEAVHRPTVHVCGFVPEGAAPGLADLAGSVTRRVIAALTRFTDLTVVGPDHTEEAVDFVLSGAIAATDGKVVAEILLREAVHGHYIWSDFFECGSLSDDRVAQRIAIADRIVVAVGQPSGVLVSYLAQEAPNSSSAESKSFESVLRFHSYWRSFDPLQYDQVRQALEQTILRDPHYAEAFACLSQMYSNAIRFNYAGVAHDLHRLQRAISLAKQAVHLSPGSSRGYLALGIALWFDGQVENAITTLRKSRELNPNDMEVAAELGLRHCFRQDWDEGVPLIEWAYQRNAALPATHRIGLSMWHYHQGRFDQALVEARNMDMPGVIYPYVMIAISAHQMGRDKEAKSALGSILTLCPDYGELVAADLERRNVHPELASIFIRGLRDAGLACPSASRQPQGRIPVKLRRKEPIRPPW
jgi:adenylate cyclase